MLVGGVLQWEKIRLSKNYGATVGDELISIPPTWVFGERFSMAREMISCSKLEIRGTVRCLCVKSLNSTNFIDKLFFKLWISWINCWITATFLGVVKFKVHSFHIPQSVLCIRFQMFWMGECQGEILHVHHKQRQFLDEWFFNLSVEHPKSIF